MVLTVLTLIGLCLWPAAHALERHEDEKPEKNFRVKKLKYQPPDPYHSRLSLEYETTEMRQQRYERIMEIRLLVSAIAEDQGLKPIVRIPPASEQMDWLRTSLEDLRQLKVNQYVELFEEIKGRQLLVTADVKEVELFKQNLIHDLMQLKDLKAQIATEKVAETLAPKKVPEIPAAVPAPLAQPLAQKATPMTTPVAPPVLAAPTIVTDLSAQTAKAVEAAVQAIGADSAQAVSTTAPAVVAAVVNQVILPEETGSGIPERYIRMNPVAKTDFTKPLYRDHIAFLKPSVLIIEADVESLEKQCIPLKLPVFQ